MPATPGSATERGGGSQGGGGGGGSSSADADTETAHAEGRCRGESATQSAMFAKGLALSTFAAMGRAATPRASESSSQAAEAVVPPTSAEAQQLMGMGFERRLVEAALMQASNDLAAATELLLDPAFSHQHGAPPPAPAAIAAGSVAALSSPNAPDDMPSSATPGSALGAPRPVLGKAAALSRSVKRGNTNSKNRPGSSTGASGGAPTSCKAAAGPHGAASSDNYSV